VCGSWSFLPVLSFSLSFRFFTTLNVFFVGPPTVVMEPSSNGRRQERVPHIHTHEREETQREASYFSLLIFGKSLRNCKGDVHTQPMSFLIVCLCQLKAQVGNFAPQKNNLETQTQMM
jgi:hypothetical protein